MVIDVNIILGLVFLHVLVKEEHLFLFIFVQNYTVSCELVKLNMKFSQTIKRRTIAIDI
jgi:hypothetical protein